MTRLLHDKSLDPYLHYLQASGDFFLINLVFLVVFVTDRTLETSQIRIAWLLCNAAYLPLVYRLTPGLKSRVLHIDRLVASTLKLLLIHALLFVSALYFVGIDDVSPVLLSLFYLGCFILFPVWRTIARLILKQYRINGKNYRRIAIIGFNQTAERLSETFLSDPGFGYRVIGCFSDLKSDSESSRLRCNGSISDLELLAEKGYIDEIFYTLGADCDRDENTLIQATRIADTFGLQFNYVPQLSKYLPRGVKLVEIGSVPILTINTNPLSSSFNRRLKRTLDITVSGLALALSPVVLLPSAIAIKLSSPGPVFFRQKRTGFHGNHFNCIKLRTMRINHESDNKQATRDDTRITTVGAFLRRTSLDEIPQFWNVLKGDMSIVGPRPHMLAHSDQYSSLIDRYRVRHIVKPGITGWAQVNGYRGETRHISQMEKRIEYDVFYIENWTMMFDIKIIFRTLLNVFRNDPNAF